MMCGNDKTINVPVYIPDIDGDNNLMSAVIVSCTKCGFCTSPVNKKDSEKEWNNLQRRLIIRIEADKVMKGWSK